MKLNLFLNLCSAGSSACGSGALSKPFQIQRDTQRQKCCFIYCPWNLPEDILAFHRRDLQEIAEQVSGRILHKGLLRDDRLTYLNLTIALLDDYAGRGPTPLLQCFLSIISTSGLSRLNNSNCSSGSVASLSGGFAIVDDKKPGSWTRLFCGCFFAPLPVIIHRLVIFLVLISFISLCKYINTKRLEVRAVICNRLAVESINQYIERH